MKHINSIILTLLTALLALPASAKSTVALATPEQLAAAGLSSEPVEIPGGTIIFDNEIATFSLAYTDQWGTDENYGIHDRPSSSYKLKVGDSDVFSIGVSPAGQTNPAFSGYEDGVMATGSVFKIDAKMSGWITVFNILFNPAKQYVVFENNTGALPYTLGGSDGEYKINYCLPMSESGDNAGYINFEDPSVDKYFLNKDGKHIPQFPYLVSNMESSPDYGLGYITFKVTAGNSYYVSGLGSRMLCQGYVFSDDTAEPAVTYLATNGLPEVNFRTRSNMPLMEGETFQSGDLFYTVIDREACTCKTAEGGGVPYPYTYIEGNVEIPAKVSDGNVEYSVVEIGSCSYTGSQNLISVKLPESVKKIGGDAFNDCGALVSVELPALLVEIGNGAFNNCGELSSIQIPSSVTSLGACFSGCKKLTSIDIPEGIEIIYDGTFRDCSSLTSIVCPNSLQEIQGFAFERCSNLKTVSLPESLTAIGWGGFGACIALEKVTYSAQNPVEVDGNAFEEVSYANATLDMPNASLEDVKSVHPWNRFIKIIAADGSTSATEPVVGEYFEYNGVWYTVTNVEEKLCKTRSGGENNSGNNYEGNLIIPSVVSNGSVEFTVVEIGNNSFYGCEGLLSVSLPSTVTHISEAAFQNCTNLVSIDLPENLEEIRNYAFAGCEKLASIEFPNSVRELGWNTFAFCTSLTSLVLPASLENIGEATFKECHNLESVTFNEGLKSIGFWGFLNCTSLKSLDFPDSLTDLGELSFENCSAIESVTFGKSLARIHNHVFTNCSGIVSVRLPDSLESIGEDAFGRCTSLKTVELPSTLSVIGYNAFNGCTSLESIQLPEALEVIEGWTFAGCTNLASVTFPGSLKEIRGAAFSGCEKLEFLTFPESLESIGNECFKDCGRIEVLKFPVSLTSIGDDSFINCSKISSITFNEGLTEMGSGVFADCIAIEEIQLPNTLTSLGQNVFGNCENLKSVIFPTSLTSIGSGSFNGCKKLESVNLPSTLTDLGEWVFGNCYGLKSIYFPASLANIGYSCFAGSDSITHIEYAAKIPVETGGFEGQVYDNATLAVPNASLADVRTTEPWSNFKHITAKDGSYYAAGTDFEYEGLVYTVLDAEAMTCETKAGHREDSPNYIADGRMRTGHFGAEGITIPGNYCEGEIVIPSIASFSGNNYTVVGIGTDGFHDCSKLTSVTFPETLETIGEASFEDAGLTSLNLPNSLKEIVHSAFIACKSLKEVSFPESMKKLGEKAFYGCIGLETVEFPSSIEIIENAFDSCYNVNTVLYNAELPITCGRIFPDEVYDDATLKMPNAALSDVRATESWRDFKHIEAKDGSYSPGLPEGEDFEYEGIWYTVINSEEKTLKTKDGSDRDNPGNHFEGDLTIPSTVNFDKNKFTVIEICHHSFASQSGLTSLSLPISVRKLADAAFENCENLVSVELPDSLSEVEGWVFNECKALRSIVLPEGLTYVGERMFAGCTALESVKLPSTIKEIRGFSLADAAFTSIELPEGLETIGGEAFTGCTNLTSITFPNTITAIWDRAFSRTGLLSVMLPESLQALGDGAFYHNYELESIVLPSSITSIGLDAFGEGDGKLISVTYNAENPLEASPWIFGQTDELYARATLTMPNATLESIQAVEPWNKFQHIVAKDGTVEPSLAAGEDFEYEGIWYTVIDAEAKTVRTKSGIDGVGANNWTGELIIPATVFNGSVDYAVIEVGLQSFCNNEQLTSVSLSEGVVKIGSTAFGYCKNLTTVSLPNSIESIGQGAFDQCSGLTSINLPEGLTAIDEIVFRQCSSLTSIELPEGLTSIGLRAFEGCVSLTSIRIPDSVVSIDQGAFARCSDLNTIVLPQGLTEISGSMLGACSSLSSIQIPAAVTVIGNSAFVACENLQSIVLPENLREIQTFAFSDCSKLIEMSFPENLTKIGYGAFMRNYALTEIHLPASITEIESLAFNGCPLADIHYAAYNPITAESDIFGEGVYLSATLDVPNATLTDVQATTPWNLFRNIIASDGSILPAEQGEDFEYEGIIYTVIDSEAKTC
ncbi:MAG: leucine-rich repeat domain-containing protein, partial [Muribaculaceae bacterium]|nr:leucine-rich repeat domain-containing protein [Muribaculaceae bacterium]